MARAPAVFHPCHMHNSADLLSIASCVIYSYNIDDKACVPPSVMLPGQHFLTSLLLIFPLVFYFFTSVAVRLGAVRLS